MLAWQSPYPHIRCYLILGCGLGQASSKVNENLISSNKKTNINEEYKYSNSNIFDWPQDSPKLDNIKVDEKNLN